MNRLAIFVLALCTLALAASAQVVPDRYILQLSGEPAAAYANRLGHRAHSADSIFRSRVATLQQQHARIRQTLTAKGAQTTGETTAVTNMMFVRFPDSRAAELSAIAGVLRVYPVRLHNLTLDHALPLEKVPDAWNQIGGSGNAGVGIKVAVLDTGVDLQHPGFSDPSLVPPAGFPMSDSAANAAFVTNKIIVARSYGLSTIDGSVVPALPTDGHGTGVGMIVAGATNPGPLGPITGVAPKAFLGNYRVFDDGVPPHAQSDWIIAAINDAVSDGMDIITMSLGSVLAPRPTDDPEVLTVEAAVAAGKIVTISAGNSGSDANTIGTPGTAPNAITVGSRPNDRTFAASVQADGMPAVMALPGNGPNSPGPIVGPLLDVTQFDPTAMACNSLPANSLTGAVALILRGICSFEIKIDNAQQAGAIAAVIYNDAARSIIFGMDVGAASLPAESVSYADGISLQQAAANGPVNVSVGFSLVAFPVGINQLSVFSSRGPSSGNANKPDLIAVGENVYTASLGGGFVVESGTSFSAPMVAGSAALIEAARPGLSAQQYRSLLINTANPVSLDSGSPLTVQQQGSGFLNVLAALNGTVTAFPTSLGYGVGSATFDQTAALMLTNVGSAPDTYSITVQPIGGGPTPVLDANSVQLNPGQSQNIAVELSGASLDPGAYQGFLLIQGTQSQVIATVPYWYAVPSGAATNISVLSAPANGGPASRQDIYIRPTDAQGIPAGATPAVTVTSGAGRVVFIQSIDDQAPGIYHVQVRMGPFGGASVFHIVSGDAAIDITIQSP
jgi:minor extracellular serine protease Vpr